MSNGLKQFSVSVILLAAIALITTATSIPRPNPNPIIKDYWVTSNCLNAVKQPELITTKDDQITNPANSTFTRYGFPNDNVFVGQTVTSGSPGLTQVCEKESRKSMSADHVYVCTDEKSNSCKITFSTQKPTSN